MLYTPNDGQNILKWAKEATREINANHIQNGIGVKVTRTPNGTNLIVHPGGKGSGGHAFPMPFDCQLIDQTDDTAAIEVHILKGGLYYGAGNDLVEIQPMNVVGNDYWDLNISVTDGLMLGVVCSYDSYSDVSIPESFSVGTIPSNAELMNAQGLQYYPLVKFIKVGQDEEYNGPYIFSFQVKVTSQENDTYYAIQCYHGDIVFDNNDYSPWIGIVESGSGGSYAVSPADGSGQNADTINVVELAGCTTLPHGSRVIVHRIMVESLAAGQTSSGS